MARVRCYRCGIETLNLSWGSNPRCSNCDAPLPVPSRVFGREHEDGEQPGVEASVSLHRELDAA